MKVESKAPEQSEVEQALREDDTESNDEALIGGFGPGLGENSPEHGSELAENEPEEAPNESAPAKPLFKGLTKSFANAAELAEYTTELERKLIEHEAKLSVYDRIPNSVGEGGEPAGKAKPAVSYAERLFVDPDGVINELRQEILTEVTKTSEKAEGDKRFWSEFYDANPDLRGCEELVDLKLAQNREAWKKVTLGEAKKLLADEARKYVSRIRESAKPTETLSRGRATALPASAGSAPKTEPQAAPRTFADQIKALHKRGKKVS